MKRSVFSFRLSKFAIAVLAMPLLAGCMETVVRSQIEADNRARAQAVAAQGNPRFVEPELSASVAQFEADFPIYGTDPARLGSFANGTACPVSQEKAYELLAGMSFAEAMRRKQAGTKQVEGFTMVSDLKAVRLVALSGTCGPDGPVGPVVLLGTTRDVMRMKIQDSFQVTAIDSILRLEGTWQGGKRSGPFKTITMTRSKLFKPGESGLEEKVDDWAYLNDIVKSVTASYMYQNYSNGEDGRYIAAFSRNAVTGNYSTMIIENLDREHIVSTTYNGATYAGRSRLKNGQMHGWSETDYRAYDPNTTLGVIRKCYQNGEEVKALECPST